MTTALKQGQVTIYIILGFVILIALGVLFYMKTDEIEREIQTEIPGKAQFAGQEELRNFMDACIKEAIFNGIEIMRLQGGYIWIPDSIPTKIIMDEGTREVIYDNDIPKVRINKYGKGNKVPYWLDSENRLYIPTKEFMEDSLAEYVEESVTQCIDDFNTFKAQGYLIEYGNAFAVVEIDDNTKVRIDLPIIVEKGNVKFEERDFALSVPINFKKAVEAQTDIVLGEYINSYFESNIKHLISVYSYSGGEKNRYDLPPLSFTTPNTDCKMVTWSLDEARDKIIENLRNNFKYFKVKGMGDSNYRALEMEILSEPYKDLYVKFDFSDENLEFDIQPREGNIIKPHVHTTTGIKLLPLFCNIKYQYKYSLRFPVISSVSLADTKSLNVEGRVLDYSKNFVFKVPIGVNLCGNQERNCTGKPKYALSELKINMSRINVSKPIASMFCDEDMKLSRPFSINIFDAYNSKPIEDATIFYKCADNDCFVGFSDENGILKTKLPLCMNGQLYAIKENYSQTNLRLSTEEGGQTKDIPYRMEPLKELNVEIKLIDLPTFIGNYYETNGFKAYRCTGIPVTANEAVLGANDVGEKNIILSSIYGNTPIALSYPEYKTIKLVSGDYGISTIVEGNAIIEPVTKNGETISVTKDGKTYKGAYIFGTYIIDVSFTLEEIKSARKIVFYVPVETVYENIDLINRKAIAQEGSLYMTKPVDDDCNPSTPLKEVEIKVDKEEVSKLLKPRLA